MFVDIHMHERTFSKDSFLSLEEIVNISKEKGLDAICITDHDSMGLKEFAMEYSKKVHFPIFVGVEYYSLQGDIVTFGIHHFPRERIPAQDYLDMVHEQNGICFSAHPFRNNNRGLGEHLLTLSGLTGIEALNGSTDEAANRKAYRYARQLGVQAIGASDCHVPEKVGRFATWLPSYVDTLEDFIACFKTETSQPAYYKDGGYHIADFDGKIPVFE